MRQHVLQKDVSKCPGSISSKSCNTFVNPENVKSKKVFQKKTRPCQSIQWDSEEFAMFVTERQCQSWTVGDQATVTLLQEPPECTRVAIHSFLLLSLSLSGSLSLSLSSAPTFLPSSPSTSLHQPPFGLLTREIKGRVCLIRLGEKPSPGGSEAVPGNKPREENRHLNIS